MSEVTIYQASGRTDEQIDHIEHTLETMAESFAQRLPSPIKQEKR